jgi:hypothetical protein
MGADRKGTEQISLGVFYQQQSATCPEYTFNSFLSQSPSPATASEDDFLIQDLI